MSAVVPVFRNATTVEALRARLASVLPADHEVVFVDDACPAGSGAVLTRLAAVDARVRLVRHAVNRGQHAAVLTGVAAARGAAVVVLDADLQDPPEAIPALLERLAAPDRPGAVFALRRGAYERRGRLVTGRLFRSAVRLLSTRGLPPGAGMFVALRGDVARAVGAAARPSGRGPYVVGLIARRAAPIAGVPVTRSPSLTTAYTGSMRIALGARGLLEALRR